MFSIAWGKKTVRQYRHPNQICPVHDWRESHGNLSTGDSQFLPINAFRFKSGTCIRRLFLPACPNEHNRKNPKKWVVVREDVSWANLPGQLGEPTTLVAAQPRNKTACPLGNPNVVDGHPKERRHRLFLESNLRFASVSTGRKGQNRNCSVAKKKITRIALTKGSQFPRSRSCFDFQQSSTHGDATSGLKWRALSTWHSRCHRGRSRSQQFLFHKFQSHRA